MKSGIFVLDKPRGPTSRQCDVWFSRMTGLKAGHAGTLDPKVSGVVPVLFGKATKLMPVFQKMDKDYIAAVHLHNQVGKDEFENVLSSVVGEISQIPPKKSAVARKLRKRHVYEARLLDFMGRTALVFFRVQSGTYIRKLIHDMGEKMGGAHMVELRRTRAGPFTEDMAHSFHELADWLVFEKQGMEQDSIFLTIEQAVEMLKLPRLWISSADKVVMGSPVFSGNVEKMEHSNPGHYIAIFHGNRMIALGRLKNDERIVAVPDAVLV